MFVCSRKVAALRLDCVNKGGNTDMAKKLVSTLNGLSV